MARTRTEASIARAGLRAGAQFSGPPSSIGEDFDFAQLLLNVLMLGDGGWMQITNLALSGVMVLVAGVGMVRAGARGIRIGVGI